MDPQPQDTQYDAIFDACVDLLTQSQASVDDCLAAYPDYADQLEQDLKLVVLTMRLKKPRLSSDAVMALEGQLYAAMPSSPNVIHLNPLAALGRTAAAVLIGLFLLVGASGVTIAASADDMPGDSLYGVKRFWEAVIVFLASFTGQVDDVRVQLAQTRLDEVQTLAASGELQADHLEDLTQALQAAFAQVDDPAILQALSQRTAALLTLPAITMYEDQRQNLEITLSTVNVPEPVTEPEPSSSPTITLTLSATPTSSATATNEAADGGIVTTQTRLPSPTATQTPEPTLTPRFAPTATRTPLPTAQGQVSPLPPSPTWTPLPTLTFGPTLPTLTPTMPVQPGIVPGRQATPTPRSPQEIVPTATWYPWIQATFDACNLTRTAVPGVYDNDPFCGS